MAAILTRFEFHVPRDGPLQIRVLVAWDQAYLCESGQMLFSFGKIIERQIGFAEVLTRAAVPRIERDRLPIMGKGRFPAAVVADRRSRYSLDFGILRVAQRRKLQGSDGFRPVARSERILARSEIGVERFPSEWCRQPGVRCAASA